MPRNNRFNNRRFNSTCDQRRAMARHIAGVFQTYSGTIVVSGGDPNALLGLLTERARPLQGMARKSDAHRALVAQVYEQLVKDGHVRLNKAGATMSGRFMEKQAGVSRQLRERAAASKQSYVGRPSRRKALQGATA